MSKNCILLVIACVILGSCNRNLGPVFSKRDHLEVIDPDFDFLTAKAKFKFSDGDDGVSASANFRFQKDSVIWISITPGLGIEAARVLIDIKNVFVLDKINKRYYEYTFDDLSKKYDFDFSFEMIQSVLLGNLIEPYKRQKVLKQDNYYTYTASIGDYFFENFIGSHSMKLERVRVIDGQTKNTISVNYSDFTLVGSQIFPNEILAIIDYATDKPNTEIEISYNKLEMESSQLKFPYSVPNKYEKK